VLDVKRRGGHRRAAQGRRVHLAPDTQEAVAELTVRPTDAADTRLTSDRALDADVEDRELIAGRTCILISHDLLLVARIGQRIFVMQGGRMVVGGETAALLKNPIHPLTKELLAASQALA